jgi:hypothetical protein
MCRPPFSAVVVIAGLSTVCASIPAGAAPLVTPELGRPSIETTLVETVGWRRRYYWRHGYPVPYVYYPPAYGTYVPPPAYAYPPAYGAYPPRPAAGNYGNYPPPPAAGDYGNYPLRPPLAITAATPLRPRAVSMAATIRPRTVTDLRA